jgi:DNA-binding response OmpR family regulator
MPKHVLVVEDEPDTAELIELHLKNDGYRVTVAGDGDQALKKVHKHMPDLVILDLMIPEITGVEVCKFIRKDPATQSIPIIMCTAKTGEIDKILGLELGADDYVTKPFSPRELLLRVKNLIKRSDSSNVKADERLVIGEIVIDKNTHEVKVDGQTIDLTATEYKLLILFTEKIGRVLSREALLRDIWGYKNDIETRTVDMHVQRLRNKLLSSKNSIFTVRGFGYKFIAE